MGQDKRTSPGAGRVRLRCTDRIDRLHPFGYIVYRCITLLVVVVKCVKWFRDDWGLPELYGTVQDPSRHKRPPPPLSLRSGGPPFIPFGS